MTQFFTKYGNTISGLIKGLCIYLAAFSTYDILRLSFETGDFLFFGFPFEQTVFSLALGAAIMGFLIYLEMLERQKLIDHCNQQGDL